MTNMSYCRFENTYHDLKDCIENFTDLNDLSKSEQVYALKIRELCKEFLEYTQNEEENEEENEEVAND